MTNKISNVLLLFVVIFSFSCKKNEINSTSTTTLGAGFFVEGNGMRKVWGIESAFNGLGAFNLEQLTATPDGYIHTPFTYAIAGVNGSPATYTAYRKKINIATGDTVATNGIPASINKTYIGQQQSGCLTLGLVPYTDKLVYSNTSLVNGNPNWQP